MRKVPRAIYVLCVICAFMIPLTLASCGDTATPEADGPETISVVASSFPLYDFARIVGGEQADVVLLPPPGLSPHSFEPTPKHIETIESADMFIYSGAGLEPWVEDVLAGIENQKLLVVNAADGAVLMEIADMEAHTHDEQNGDGDHDTHTPDADEGEHHHGLYDPHYWLDFENAKVQVDNILGGYLQIDSEHAGSYLERTDGYTSTLELLDQMYRDTLTVCPGKDLVSAGHFAFGYLAHRYGLNHRAIYGAAHNVEPSPRELTEMVDYIGQHDIKYIVADAMLDAKVARTIRDEAGVEIVTLNPAGNVSKDQLENGVTFIDIMQENLKGLKLILGCE
ncbi:MAG: zinc ABC transporter substrate-binding protein [Deltaproteobacteria bacterium]|nr:zinc ABC transporter substrate-binding protein [Candidatus Zymogenaceae bacterium]